MRAAISLNLNVRRMLQASAVRLRSAGSDVDLLGRDVLLATISYAFVFVLVSAQAPGQARPVIAAVLVGAVIAHTTSNALFGAYGPAGGVQAVVGAVRSTILAGTWAIIAVITTAAAWLDGGAVFVVSTGAFVTVWLQLVLRLAGARTNPELVSASVVNSVATAPRLGGTGRRVPAIRTSTTKGDSSWGDRVRDLVSGSRVLVTGGGGSIGAELARRASLLSPTALTLVDHDETHLFDAAAGIDGACHQVLGDIRDKGFVDDVVATYKPDLILHAAAHKHVPLLELHPEEAIRTNVLGTFHVVASARRYEVPRFVLISTDKATQARNVMGASKWLAEQIVLMHAAPERRYCAVRFGNVLGTRGSVTTVFARQIARGGPVTVTDPRMTRYFMSIEESTELVLMAGAMTSGGELFMLDMGAPVHIVGLAERMIRDAGVRPGIDIQIEFTGIRPGEQLSEELYTTHDVRSPTAHPRIGALSPVRIPETVLSAGLERLRSLCESRDGAAARAVLFSLTEGMTEVAAPPSVGTLISLTDDAAVGGLP